MSPSTSHYERLGVPSHADPETLRQAFRRRSKDLHPDTTTLPALEAAQQFQQLRQSYELLADPERRRRYDDQLNGQRSQPSVPSSTSVPRKDHWSGIGERRPLSGGEWFSLVLLGGALLLSLVLGLGVALVQGREWQVSPGWLNVEQTQASTALLSSDAIPAAGPDAIESAFTPGIGAVVKRAGG